MDEKVKDIIREKKGLIDVHCNTSVKDTIDILTKEKLISIPVYAKLGEKFPTSSGGGFNVMTVEKRQYIGMVNLADILHFGLRSLNIEEQLNKCIYETILFTNVSLSVWVENASENLITVMGRFAKGVHHALVQNKEEDAENSIKILSLTDIVHYFFEHQESYPMLHSIFHKHAGNFAQTEVEYIKHNHSMMEAVVLLQHVSSLPVLDFNGDMMSVLSRSDLRDGYQCLFDPIISRNINNVMDFLNYRHANKIPPPVYVTPTDTLYTAVNTILSKKIHRVWIRQTPGTYRHSIAGVLTLSNIVEAFYKHFKQIVYEKTTCEKCGKDDLTLSETVKNACTGNETDNDETIATSSDESPAKVMKVSGCLCSKCNTNWCSQLCKKCGCYDLMMKMCSKCGCSDLCSKCSCSQTNQTTSTNSIISGEKAVKSDPLLK